MHPKGTTSTTLGVMVALVLTVTGCGSSESEASADELRIADPGFLLALDSDDGQSGYAMIGYGIAETLMRVDNEMRIQPWIAESADWIDPLTLKVTLRDDVTFWDGSEVDAEAVMASFERSLERNPAAASVLPEGTRFEASGNELTIVTKEPVGALINNLASYHLVVKKESEGGDPVYTGAYQPEDHVANESVRLVAHEGHRDPPDVGSLFVRHIADENTRRLALEAGDVDIAYDVLPTSGKSLETAGFKVVSSPTANQIMMLLNSNRKPLDDPAVRQALSLAIDRDGLVQAVLEGVGTPAEGIVQTELGIEGVQELYRHDMDEAATVLEEAGWVAGADGVRERNGERLQLTLSYYTQRAQLEPIATILQGELGKAGFEIEVENVADIVTAVAENDFTATLWSATTVATGDVGPFLAANYAPGADRHKSKRLEDLVAEYLSVSDAERRLEIFGEIQSVAAEEVPLIPLVHPEKLVATTEAAAGRFTPHPLENYRFTPGFSIHD